MTEPEDIKPTTFKGLTVTFKKDVSQYKVDKIMDMIKLLYDVETVDPVITEPAHDHINKARVRVEFYRKIRQILKES